MDWKTSEISTAQAAPLRLECGSRQIVKTANVMIVDINATMMMVTFPSARNAKLRNELTVYGISIQARICKGDMEDMYSRPNKIEIKGSARKVRIIEEKMDPLNKSNIGKRKDLIQFDLPEAWICAITGYNAVKTTM